MTKYCPNCGKELQDTDNFCIECGTRIVKTEPMKQAITEDKEPEQPNEQIMSNIDGNELFFSPKESIRKTGEKRYGKGTLKITDQNLYLEYKRALGQPEHYVISKDKIEKVMLIKENPPVEVVGPGYGFGSDQWWYVLDIRLKEGNGFQMMVGQPWRAMKKIADKMVQKYDRVMELLNPPGVLPENPWDPKSIESK